MAHKGRRLKARRTRGDGTRGPKTNVRVAQPQPRGVSTPELLSAGAALAAFVMINLPWHTLWIPDGSWAYVQFT